MGCKGKGKGRALDIAPQVDTATAEALRYMARIACTCLIPAQYYSLRTISHAYATVLCLSVCHICKCG